MLSTLWSALRKPASRQPQRPRARGARLCLESLEERTLLSGVLTTGGGPGGTSGGPASQVIVQSTSGSSGTSGGSGSTSSTGSGNLNLSGPGYPLVSDTGATRTDAGTLSQTSQTVVMVSLTGTPGGSGSTLTVVPVCVGGTSTPGGAGSVL